MEKMRTILVVKAKDKSEARTALETALQALDENEKQKNIVIKVSVPAKNSYSLVSAWR